jgi:hypothetical protein
MRYLVQCEIHADLGDDAAETIEKSLVSSRRRSTSQDRNHGRLHAKHPVEHAGPPESTTVELMRINRSAFFRAVIQ